MLILAPDDRLTELAHTALAVEITPSTSAVAMDSTVAWPVNAATMLRSCESRLSMDAMKEEVNCPAMGLNQWSSRHLHFSLTL